MIPSCCFLFVFFFIVVSRVLWRRQVHVQEGVCKVLGHGQQKGVRASVQSEAALQAHELSQVLLRWIVMHFKPPFAFPKFLMPVFIALLWFCRHRSVQMKTLLGLTATPSSAAQSQKPRPKLSKPKAEPPPKKRKKWKEEFVASESSAEEGGEDGKIEFLLFLFILFGPSLKSVCLSLILRPKPPSAFRFAVAQHQNHEGDLQELRGAFNQCCFRRGRDDGPREVQW